MLLPILLAASQNLLWASGASSEPPTSCSETSSIFVFKQRFDPEVGDGGAWGIEGLDVLDPSGEAVTTNAFSQSYTHEEIASACLKSPLIGGEEGYERAEREWAQSEVGEGVEELWERSWNTAGRFISTLAPSCGAEPVPAFFDALHHLHARYDPVKLLAEADITPSADTSYSLREIIEALSVNDEAPYVTCINTTLSTVFWPLTVRGKFQSGTFEPFALSGVWARCPDEGILYPPSQVIPPPEEKSRWDPIHRPEPRAITKLHDESRIYRPPSDGARGDPKKLGFFKRADQEREHEENMKARKGYQRDEL